MTEQEAIESLRRHAHNVRDGLRIRAVWMMYGWTDQYGQGWISEDGLSRLATVQREIAEGWQR